MKGKYLALAASMLLSLGAASASAQPRNFEQGKHPQHRHKMERYEHRSHQDARHMHKKEFVLDKNCRECRLAVRDAKKAHRFAAKSRRYEAKARQHAAHAHQHHHHS